MTPNSKPKLSEESFIKDKLLEKVLAIYGFQYNQEYEIIKEALSKMQTLAKAEGYEAGHSAGTQDHNVCIAMEEEAVKKAKAEQTAEIIEMLEKEIAWYEKGKDEAIEILNKRFKSNGEDELSREYEIALDEVLDEWNSGLNPLKEFKQKIKDLDKVK